MKEKYTFSTLHFSPLNRSLLCPQDGCEQVVGGIQAGTPTVGHHGWDSWSSDVVSGWLSPWAEEMPTEERAGVTQGERGWASLGL